MRFASEVGAKEWCGGAGEFAACFRLQTHRGLTGLALLVACSNGADPGDADAGPELVFTRFADPNSFDSDLYSVRSDGSGQRPLLAGATIDRDPAWAPDGHRLAFVSSGRETGDGLYVMDADGENVTPVTTTPAYTVSPAWSPDGREIAFAAGGCESIFVVSVDGSGLRMLVSSSVVGPLYDCVRLASPTWSPDGSRVAFGAWFLGHGTGTLSLWIVNADGTGLMEFPGGAAIAMTPA